MQTAGSSINLRPTFNYSQPEDYRFSHDSVFLAQEIFDRHKADITRETRVLDLCAGCGIIGLDFLFHCRKELGFVPAACDFLEVQSEYEPHFCENVRRLAVENCELRYLPINYENFTVPENEKYDLVLCNPPYFQEGEGSLSPSNFKNRCRFFLDSSFAALTPALVRAIRPQGHAYFLMRTPDQKSHDLLSSARMSLVTLGRAGVVGDIRGNTLVHVTRV